MINFLTRHWRVGAAARQTIPSSNDIRQVGSGIRLNSGLQIRKLFTERVATHPAVAGMLVETNDKERRGWFLSNSVRFVVPPKR